jgi:uncharacterized protein YecE (DUF72 family)
MLHVGVSGWSFPEWKDTFYAGVPKSRWLEHYATMLPTVEVNYTFRRTMSEATATKWRTTVGPGFRFAVKAHQRITHYTRLGEPADTLPHFLEGASMLGPCLGPILFQLPPTFERDDDRLGHFLEVLPNDLSPAFEFRHESWAAPPVRRLLERAGAALVISETDDNGPDEAITAPFTYLRLRKTDYTEGELQDWARRIGTYGVDAWVYFKHETASPAYAGRLRELLP